MTLRIDEPFRWGQRPVVKAVTNITPWTGGPPLRPYSEEPQQKAARFLQVYKCGWFYKAEHKISGDIARLEWSISSGDSESDESETELKRPDLDIPFDALSPIDQFQRLLERPNPSQTGSQLFQKLQIRRDMAGTAMWYLENQPLPTAIYGISPARMWPARDRQGILLGWVMDKDSRNPVPFDADEIVNFPTASADDGDGDLFGVGVVEAVYSQVPLTDLIARHTTDLLTTGGRLAGMLWPKQRTLSEDEFVEAQRAWRNVASDPNAARRLLLFPEPMEWAPGASTPAEIGLPELAELNRTEILTAFPISDKMLGVPHREGMNASGSTRIEERRDYWEGTIEPRVEELKEVIQTRIISRYEQAMGQTFDFDMPIPNLDDAPTLIEKVGALKGLTSVGFDPKEAIAAVGLDHIKWIGTPEPVAPPPPIDTGVTANVAGGQSGDQTTTGVNVAKSADRDSVAQRGENTGKAALSSFFKQQRDRITENLRKTLPATKAARKADPGGWWDQQAEDAALKSALRGLYLEVGRGSLQVVADTLDRFVYSPHVVTILNDLLEYGGDRIVDINVKTHGAIVDQLTEGTRRGYSINQLVDGVPSEQYPGVQNALLDNGVAVFDDLRAETIARTETMLSYNRAAVTGYREFGVQELQAIDGDYDAECAARNGQVFPIDVALGIDDHPNGTLDWVPVLDKSWHEPPEHSVKVSIEPQVINVHMPEPVVNVAAPEVRVDSPTVNVAAPEVTVRPVVTVKAQPSDVTVNLSPEMRITAMPDRVTSRAIDRDKAGRITRTVDVETDA